MKDYGVGAYAAIGLAEPKDETKTHFDRDCAKRSRSTIRRDDHYPENFDRDITLDELIDGWDDLEDDEW